MDYNGIRLLGQEMLNSACKEGIYALETCRGGDHAERSHKLGQQMADDSIWTFNLFFWQKTAPYPFKTGWMPGWWRSQHSWSHKGATNPCNSLLRRQFPVLLPIHDSKSNSLARGVVRSTSGDCSSVEKQCLDMSQLAPRCPSPEQPLSHETWANGLSHAFDVRRHRRAQNLQFQNRLHQLKVSRSSPNENVRWWSQRSERRGRWQRLLSFQADDFWREEQCVNGHARLLPANEPLAWLPCCGWQFSSSHWPVVWQFHVFKSHIDFFKCLLDL